MITPGLLDPHPNCKCLPALSAADLVVIEAEAIVAAARGWDE